MQFYQNLPEPPDQISGCTILTRFVDSIGHRFYHATDGFTEHEINFRPVEGSMSMMEVISHLYRLLFWTYSCFNTDVRPNKGLETFEEYRAEILMVCEKLSTHLKTFPAADLDKTNILLRRANKTYPFWYLINGPIADALSHIGQLTTWRRIAGNPIARISPFTGEPY